MEMKLDGQESGGRSQKRCWYTLEITKGVSRVAEAVLIFLDHKENFPGIQIPFLKLLLHDPSVKSVNTSTNSDERHLERRIHCLFSAGKYTLSA